jgi:REP element-mobilizing transposase RayT
LFGVLGAGSVDLTPLGRLVEQRWRGIPARTTRATTHDLVVMPDHLHGILQVAPPPGYTLTPGERAFGPLQRQSLGLAINLLKGGVTRRARELGLIAPTTRLWLRGYHDRIIRDARHLANARAYIRNNPIRAIESAWRGWDGRAGGAPLQSARPPNRRAPAIFRAWDPIEMSSSRAAAPPARPPPASWRRGATPSPC